MDIIEIIKTGEREIIKNTIDSDINLLSEFLVITTLTDSYEVFEYIDSIYSKHITSELLYKLVTVSCVNDSVNVLSFILQYDLDFNYNPFSNSIPIFVASEFDSVNVFELLLNSSLDYDLVNEYSHDIYLNICRYDSIECYNKLKEYEYDFNKYDEDENDDLMVLISNSSNKILSVFNIENKNYFNKYNHNALTFAVIDENIELVEELINKDFDTNFIDNEGQTLLHYALDTENYAIVKLICEKSNLLTSHSFETEVVHIENNKIKNYMLKKMDN